jgi:hypothetical protein
MKEWINIVYFFYLFELKWFLGSPLSKLCVTPPFSINFRCQIENQVSDYRLLGASSLLFILCIRSLTESNSYNSKKKRYWPIRQNISVYAQFNFKQSDLTPLVQIWSGNHYKKLGSAVLRGNIYISPDFLSTCSPLIYN